MSSPLSYQSQPTRQARSKDGRSSRTRSIRQSLHQIKIKLDCAYGIQEPLAVSSDVSFWYKELLPTAWYSDFQKLLSIRQFRRNGWRKREFRPMTCVVSNLPTIRRSYGELMEQNQRSLPIKTKNRVLQFHRYTFSLQFFVSWRLMFYRWATPRVTFTSQKIAVLGVRWSGLQHLNLPFWASFLRLGKEPLCCPHTFLSKGMGQSISDQIPAWGHGNLSGSFIYELPRVGKWPVKEMCHQAFF